MRSSPQFPKKGQALIAEKAPDPFFLFVGRLLRQLARLLGFPAAEPVPVRVR